MKETLAYTFTITIGGVSLDVFGFDHYVLQYLIGSILGVVIAICYKKAGFKKIMAMVSIVMLLAHFLVIPTAKAFNQYDLAGVQLVALIYGLFGYDVLMGLIKLFKGFADNPKDMISTIKGLKK